MDLLRCAIRAHRTGLLFLFDPKSLRIFVWKMLMNILGSLLIIYLKEVFIRKEKKLMF